MIKLTADLRNRAITEHMNPVDRIPTPNGLLKAHQWLMHEKQRLETKGQSVCIHVDDNGHMALVRTARDPEPRA